MTQLYRVGVWCAVSSKPQAQTEKESLPAQRRAGEEFARAIGGQVVARYEVPGHTRDYWSWYEAEKDIPAYRQVREDLQARKLDVIHCLDVDRLGRDPALIHQFYSLAERHGCEVYDASMPHVLGQQSMGHRYGMSVKSVAAGEDQRRRAFRQQMGMRGRVKRGLHPGRWPMGYTEIRDDSGRVTGAEFDDMIGAVQLMTRLFLDGQSYNQIRLALEASGWNLPDGRNWHAATVRRVMLNDTYGGFTSWGPAQIEAPSDKYPALWDDQTYAAVLREREKRLHSYRHPRAGPLSGIAICHRCGGPMGRVRQYRPGHYYLRCTNHALRNQRPEVPPCHPNLVPEAEAMSALRDWLAELSTPGAIDAIPVESAGLEAEMEHIQARLAGLEPERRRLALAYAKGKMDLEIYHLTDRGLRDTQDADEARLGELRARLAARPDPAERRQEIERLLRYEFDEIPAEVLGPALHRAGVQIYCEDRKILFCAFTL